MILPDSIKNKMNKVMDMRIKANKIEQEIMEWFQKNGFNTDDDSFLRVTDKLSNCDATPEQIEEILEDIRDGIFR